MWTYLKAMLQTYSTYDNREETRYSGCQRYDNEKVQTQGKRSTKAQAGQNLKKPQE
jgi:hypothetical protein